MGGSYGCRPFRWHAYLPILAAITAVRHKVLSDDFADLENTAMSYLLVFFGGGLGATLRHLINVTCARCLGTAFPWGTFIINITGSTVMGLIAGYLAFKGEASQPGGCF